MELKPTGPEEVAGERYVREPEALFSLAFLPGPAGSVRRSRPSLTGRSVRKTQPLCPTWTRSLPRPQSWLALPSPLAPEVATPTGPGSCPLATGVCPGYAEMDLLWGNPPSETHTCLWSRPHWPVSRPGQVETLQVPSWSLRNSWGFHFWPLPRSSLEAKPPLLSPVTKNESLFGSGGQRKGVPRYRGREGALSSRDRPLWGGRSLNPARHSWLWP